MEQTDPNQPQVIQPSSTPSPAPQSGQVPAAPAPAAEASPVGPIPSFGSDAPPVSAEPTGPVSQMPTLDMPTEQTVSPSPAAPKGRFVKAKRLKFAIIAGLTALVMVGGSAAAMFGIYIPNRPVNVLSASFVNTLTSPQLSFNGYATVQDTTGKASLSQLLLNQFRVNINGQRSAAQKAIDVNLQPSLGNLKVSTEVRMIGQNVYFKVGDLTPVKDFANSLAPGLGNSVVGLNKTLANQWIQVDPSTLAQIHLACFSSLITAPSNTDASNLQKAYKKTPFMKLNSQSTDKTGVRYNLTIDTSKLGSYAQSTSQSSSYQRVSRCITGSVAPVNSSTAGSRNQLPISVWVNKGARRIVQMEIDSSAQNAKSGTSSKLVLGFTYGRVNIPKPTNVKQSSQIEQQLLQLYNSSLGSLGGGPSINPILQ